jgi:hypothetical protein
VRAGNREQVTRFAANYTPAIVGATIPASRLTTRGHICVRNTGHSTANMIADSERRFQGLTATTVDGKRSSSAIALSLAAKPQTLLARFDDAVTDASQLTGGLPKGLLWLILLLVTIGLPAIAVYAIVSSYDGDN